MTETHEQRVERLAGAIGDWLGNATFGEILARMVIASDRGAGLVTVPRAVVEHAIRTQRRIEAMHYTALDAAHDLEAALAAHEQEEPQ